MNNFGKFFFSNFVPSLLILVFIAASLNLDGCDNNKIINEDKLVKIYTDLIIAQDTTKIVPPNIKELRKNIFAHYDVTEKQYDATIDYYNNNPKEWRKFFEKAISYADKLKKKSDI